MRPGFTLLELMVVLTILSLATAVTVPRLLDPPADPLTRATTTISKMLLNARLAAMRSAHTTVLVVDPATLHYSIEAMERDSGTIDLPEGITMAVTAERLRFRFEPDGTAATNAVQLLSGEYMRVLLVDPWSGEISAR